MEEITLSGPDITSLKALVQSLIVDNNSRQVTPSKIRVVFDAIIDAIASINTGGGGGGTITVDQTFDPKSENAQSGIAISAPLEDLDSKINSNKENIQGIIKIIKQPTNVDVVLTSSDIDLDSRTGKHVLILGNNGETRITVQYTVDGVDKTEEYLEPCEIFIYDNLSEGWSRHQLPVYCDSQYDREKAANLLIKGNSTVNPFDFLSGYYLKKISVDGYQVEIICKWSDGDDIIHNFKAFLNPCLNKEGRLVFVDVTFSDDSFKSYTIAVKGDTAWSFDGNPNAKQ